jgi:hypothetical protein
LPVSYLVFRDKCVELSPNFPIGLTLRDPASEETNVNLQSKHLPFLSRLPPLVKELHHLPESTGGILLSTTHTPLKKPGLQRRNASVGLFMPSGRVLPAINISERALRTSFFSHKLGTSGLFAEAPKAKGCPRATFAVEEEELLEGTLYGLHAGADVAGLGKSEPEDAQADQPGASNQWEQMHAEPRGNETENGWQQYYGKLSCPLACIDSIS